MIDIRFEPEAFAAARLDLTAAWLFPQDAPIYRRLVEIDAPRVTRYVPVDGTQPAAIGSLTSMRRRKECSDA